MASTNTSGRDTPADPRRAVYRALVVSPVPTHPTTHGNRARVVAMIEFLETAGFEVHVVVLQREDWDGQAMRLAYGDRLYLVPYKRPRRRESAVQAWMRRGSQLFNSASRHAYGADDWYDDALDPVISRLDQEIGFDLAMVEYGFMSRALLKLSTPRFKVIDTHDIFANRHQMLLRAGLEPSFYSTTPQEERRCLARADLALGIQDFETQQLLAYGGNAMTFGHTVKIEQLYLSKNSEFDLLMVGSANAMNVHGLEWFTQEVLPLLSGNIDEIRIAIAGGVCDVTPDIPGVRKLGVVPELHDVYARTRLVFNPVRGGTGLNIKSIEALGYGLPLLSTRSGVRGLGVSQTVGFRIADTPTEFAQEILSMLADDACLRRLSIEAVKLAKNWNLQHIQAFRAQLQSTFPNLSMDARI